MANTLDKQFRYETEISNLTGIQGFTYCLVLYPNTVDARELESQMTTTRLGMDLQRASTPAGALRTTHCVVVCAGMSPRKTTQEEDTTHLDEWPVAVEFEGIATDECISFCNSNGSISCLRSCFEAAKRLFSNIKELRAELDCFQDEGTRDEGHVVIRLVLGSSQETAFREYRSWVEWFVTHCEPHQRELFTLSFTRKAM